MDKYTKIGFGLAIVLILVLIFVSMNPIGRAAWNTWFYHVHKTDDVTNYQTIKQVEDTCRAMIASYNADKLRYEQYITSDSAEQRSWGEQAKIRANQTAAVYNEYILKNSFVFQGNIPSDIRSDLEFLS